MIRLTCKDEQQHSVEEHHREEGGDVVNAPEADDENDLSLTFMGLYWRICA